MPRISTPYRPSYAPPHHRRPTTPDGRKAPPDYPINSGVCPSTLSDLLYAASLRLLAACFTASDLAEGRTWFHGSDRTMSKCPAQRSASQRSPSSASTWKCLAVPSQRGTSHTLLWRMAMIPSPSVGPTTRHAGYARTPHLTKGAFPKDRTLHRRDARTHITNG
jgi:hypothetical protein